MQPNKVQIQFFATRQNGRKLEVRGHTYYIAKPFANGNISWRCTESKTSGCTGSLQTDEIDKTINFFQDHTHGPSNDGGSLGKFISSAIYDIIGQQENNAAEQIGFEEEDEEEDEEDQQNYEEDKNNYGEFGDNAAEQIGIEDEEEEEEDQQNYEEDENNYGEFGNNERQEWALYDKNAHNHNKIIPIGQYHAEKRELKEKASGNLPGKLSAETRQNAAEIDTTPTTSSAAAAGGAKIQNYAEQTPSPPAKLFELAQCEKEMRQIAKKWNLLFSEEWGFYLFMPPRDTKALKDGVLLSLTDRGDHIRMDEFHAFISQEDRTQRLPKERGEATIMRLASDQCARMECNSMAFLEAKNDPMLVFDELMFKWLAFAEADNVAKTTTTTTSSSNGTIRTVDFVIDFVMNVANVDTFLWPKKF
ncbi:hypothetical protein niasHT_020351 [Heterodera trifolii]|uniref:FLYWCH-type domain-containing protein n=1 Tax=Heterodera trifolii TaxID=157864 RepID=A0ABD2JXD5_9BILA